jgi:hypothetical protein
MVTEEPQTNLVAMLVSSPAVAVVLADVAEPGDQVALGAPVVQVDRAGLAAQADRAVLEALAELAVQVAQAVPEALAELVSQVAPAELVALAELVSQAVLAELASQVVLALNPEKEVLELVIAQVVELETAPVAPPAKIKLVIAAHHRGLVRVPKREADMAVVAAETTRAPAATEVGRAWAEAE